MTKAEFLKNMSANEWTNKRNGEVRYYIEVSRALNRRNLLNREKGVKIYVVGDELKISDVQALGTGLEEFLTAAYQAGIVCEEIRDWAIGAKVYGAEPTEAVQNAMADPEHTLEEAEENKPEPIDVSGIDAKHIVIEMRGTSNAILGIKAIIYQGDDAAEASRVYELAEEYGRDCIEFVNGRVSRKTYYWARIPGDGGDGYRPALAR